MPHIILRGHADLAALAGSFTPGRADGNDWIVRLKDIYLASGQRNAIVDCTAVRSGFSQDFYARIELKGGGLTVRVDPYMRIERNEGVQRAILGITRLLMAADPTLRFDKSNFPPELTAEIANPAASTGGQE